MPLNPKLLEIIACPACKEGLQLLADDAGLACPKCRRIYRIDDGIPVLLIDQAVMPAE